MREDFIAATQRRLLAAFAPWSPMRPEAWAEEVYRLPGAKRFRWDYCPYAREMFISLFDRSVTETILEIYSRGLKSTVVLLAMGYFIDQAPRRILNLWPTIGQAEKWSKEILCGELLDTTPCLQYLGSQTGKRNVSNTILNKLFPGGLIAAFGANSPGEMRRAKGSFLNADEVDAMEETESDEGDQLAIFHKRGDEYPDTIKVTSSYPSTKGASRIHARLETSDFRQWQSTCVICGGEPFVMHRSQLRFTADDPRDARLECPRCKGLLDDRQRHAMAHEQGFENWTPTKPFRGRRGYQANAMLWPHPVDFEKYPGGWLQCVAQQQIDAERSENPRRSLKVLVNTVDAEPFDPAEESEQPPDWKPIFDRRENYGLTVPAGGFFLTAFVDVQKYRLEVGWRAWGVDEESWGMDYRILDGPTWEKEVWEELGRELSREFVHTHGGKIGIGQAFIDGGKWPDIVYNFVRGPLQKHERLPGKVAASKGVGGKGAKDFPVINTNWTTVGKVLKGFQIGTWAAKDLIYSRMRAGLAAQEGKMHFNEQFPVEFFKALTCEEVTIKYEAGEEIRMYVNPKGQRNEALDIEVGCLAALRLRRRNWEQLEAAMIEAGAIAKGDKIAEERRPRVRKVGNSLF